MLYIAVQNVIENAHLEHKKDKEPTNLDVLCDGECFIIAVVVEIVR